MSVAPAHKRWAAVAQNLAASSSHTASSNNSLMSLVVQNSSRYVEIFTSDKEEVERRALTGIVLV